jgi:branched-chain amino acid transport system substrate-binding protein
LYINYWEKMMKKILLATIASIVICGNAFAGGHSKVNLGIILGFTGPIESLTPDMAAAAELAISEMNKSGKFEFGEVSVTRADSTCIDSAAATAAAERLITADKVNAIVGGDCSGVTTAMLENVAVANGTVMISPSATSPALSTVADNGLFFRTAPSDARQGEVVKDILMEQGYKTIAITYENSDYGKGLADSIETFFTEAGGTVTLNASHENGKGDYGAEVAALAQAGGEILVVAGYLNQGGKGMIEASLDTGAFDIFYLPDGMIGDQLPIDIGPDLNGSIGDVPGTDSEGAATFASMAEKAGFNGTGPFAPESYDAAALIMLAMQAAGSTDSNIFKDHVMDVANAPGTKIYPGELGKAIDLLRAGEKVDYVGASAVELIGPGESAGNYREILVDGGKNTTVRFR